jgi:hypothetical protein
MIPTTTVEETFWGTLFFPIPSLAIVKTFDVFNTESKNYIIILSASISPVRKMGSGLLMTIFHMR